MRASPSYEQAPTPPVRADRDTARARAGRAGCRRIPARTRPTARARAWWAGSARHRGPNPAREAPSAVAHAGEVQAARARPGRRRGGARRPAAPRAVQGPAAAGDLEHRADEHAVHVPHERVGLDLEPRRSPSCTQSGPPGDAAGPKRTWGGSGWRERREVVRARQQRRTGVDSRSRSRPCGHHSARPASIGERIREWSTRSRARARHRVPPRSRQALRSLRARQHGHIRPHQRIQRLRPHHRALIRRHLPRRVHPRLSARNRQRHRALKTAAPAHPRSPHLSLPRLHSPAEKGGAVIGDVETRGHAEKVSRPPTPLERRIVDAWGRTTRGCCGKATAPRSRGPQAPRDPRTPGELHQLEVHHFGEIAATRAELEDVGVSAGRSA